MKTNDVIDVLVMDRFAPTRPKVALRRALTAGNVVVALLFFVFVGARADFEVAAETGRFLFKCLLTLTLAITSVAATARSLRPDFVFRPRDWLVALAPCLLFLAVLVELSLVPEGRWFATAMGSNARRCLSIIPLLSLAPLAFILLAARTAAPRNGLATGILAGLTASGIAASFYATHCTDDSPLFVATWYPIATLLVVGLGAMAGRILLRW
jgi:hypothetical protein